MKSLKKLVRLLILIELILLSVSCQSQKQRVEVFYEKLDITFPEFPYLDEIQETENGFEFVWEGQTGVLPKEWFFSLAEYVNSVDAIKAYIYLLDEEGSNLPP